MGKLIEELKTIREMQQKRILRNRLCKIKLCSFRRFAKNTEINFDFPITVFVGKNGCGKTTVLKAINILRANKKPQCEFFETDLDNGGLINANLEYSIDDNMLSYKRIKQNEWSVEPNSSISLPIVYVQLKSMIGAIEKSFLYDNIGKNITNEHNVEYVIKQSKKLIQNNQKETSRKKSYNLSEPLLQYLNFILDKKIIGVQIIQHKYYSGTWGSSVIFDDGQKYSEYNAGSGEFLVACMLQQLSRVSNGGIALLDEPEISLHPGAQKRLMQILIKIIKNQRIQIIIATHSMYIIEGLPKEAIKCFRQTEDELITVEENTIFENAFRELEIDYHKKHIIVEDELACKIVNRILQEEKLISFLNVYYYPGGASNIKTNAILVYSKTNIENRFIVLDGDQQKKQVSDLSEILEKDKTLEFYEAEFKEVTGINASKISWGMDANRKDGRYDEKQRKEFIKEYLTFFAQKVFFLPCSIPEDIIYDYDELSIISKGEISHIDKSLNAKEKLKKLSDITLIPITTIEEMLIFNFIKKKNDNYRKIEEIIKTVIKNE